MWAKFAGQLDFRQWHRREPQSQRWLLRRCPAVPIGGWPEDHDRDHDGGRSGGGGGGGVGQGAVAAEGGGGSTRQRNPNESGAGHPDGRPYEVVSVVDGDRAQQGDYLADALTAGGGGGDAGARSSGEGDSDGEGGGDVDGSPANLIDDLST
jgi:hypothetical protein